MRNEPDTDLVARGWGAGIDLDPTFEIGDEAEGWTKRAVVEKPILITDHNVRCPGTVRVHGTDGLTRTCNSLLALRLTRPYTIVCRKCKYELKVEAEE